MASWTPNGPSGCRSCAVPAASAEIVWYSIRATSPRREPVWWTRNWSLTSCRGPKWVKQGCGRGKHEEGSSWWFTVCGNLNTFKRSYLWWVKMGPLMECNLFCQIRIKQPQGPAGSAQKSFLLNWIMMLADQLVCQCNVLPIIQWSCLVFAFVVKMLWLIVYYAMSKCCIKGHLLL